MDWCPPSSKGDPPVLPGKSTAFGRMNYPGGKGGVKGSSVVLVLRAGIFGKYSKQLCACARSSEPRQGHLTSLWHLGTWQCWGWPDLGLSGSFSIPIFHDLPWSTSLWLCRTLRASGVSWSAREPTKTSQHLIFLPIICIPHRHLHLLSSPGELREDF